MPDLPVDVAEDELGGAGCPFSLFVFEAGGAQTAGHRRIEYTVAAETHGMAISAMVVTAMVVTVEASCPRLEPGGGFAEAEMPVDASGRPAQVGAKMA